MKWKTAPLLVFWGKGEAKTRLTKNQNQSLNQTQIDPQKNLSADKAGKKNGAKRCGKATTLKIKRKNACLVSRQGAFVRLWRTNKNKKKRIESSRRLSSLLNL
ncbi:MAG: hypothetical protein ACK5UE_12265 [Chitinophagales bacterium]|jgi:hypothetical protein